MDGGQDKNISRQLESFPFYKNLQWTFWNRSADQKMIETEKNGRNYIWSECVFSIKQADFVRLGEIMIEKEIF